MKRKTAVAILIVITSVHAQSQTTTVGKDSVTVVAGPDFAAGGFHRWLLGDNYRDLWTTPIKVPVLDLHSFAGGLKPLEKGGGAQTVSLRFIAPDSTEWAFRSILKRVGVLPKEYEGTVIYYIFKDEGSASHPTSFAAAVPMEDAAQVLHPTGTLVVMPDDPILGDFRKEFAGLLGEIEQRPTVPKDGPAFAGASKIIGAEELLKQINSNPDDQVDARKMLNARLLDMVFGDNDRHPDQWKWARFGKKDDAPWVPIATDRDKVFVSYRGALISLARKALPNLVTFDSTYPEPTALFNNATDFDRRMLVGLDKSVWDSVATSLTNALSNSVIDSAMRSMPHEYAASSRVIGEKVKARRDGLRAEADHYYDILSRVVDIHATDSADKATVVRSADGIVDIQIQHGNDPPWFSRRFNAAETSEIRLYLHGGDDNAVVTGNVRSSIPVRIIGGNGNNTLVDQSVVGGHRNPTRLYDVGNVTDNVYKPDSVDMNANLDNALNHSFNRRPWLPAYGTLIPPQRDYGSSVRPSISVRTGRNLGVVTKVGATRYVYGFRDVPYSSMMSGQVGLSTTGRYVVILGGDKRFESSQVHIPFDASASQIEQVEFRGFGNDVPDLRGKPYEVKQTQLSLRPAVGFSLNQLSDISVGPIVRYTSTDSLGGTIAHNDRGSFIAGARPLGFPHFGQVGAQIKLHYDSKYAPLPDTLRPRAVVDIVGSGYPAAWDVKNSYESISGVAEGFFTLPAKNRPVLALRAGGKKLFGGDFPYFDAAYIGGSSSLRTEERQRYAGDASLYGTTELRVPIAKFPLIVPLDVGLLGFLDVAKVYVDGDSPGGWHKGTGGGFWVGFLNPGKSLNVLFTNNSNRRVISSFGFAF
ncbi:MAG: hypothetical protein ABR582_02225 [Gemmatimonadaceae bacterium]